ncbi:MAG TPA: hypothetical protein VF173_26425 [Thermoanaerobaculia bacterium]|nr:hypothetical protein [Thermoanaerobaculia bacterium]
MNQISSHDEVYELTGEITIRFTQFPGDEELRQLISRHGLLLLRRNEFVREQAVFKPADPSRSLSDLVQTIEQEGTARAVWANRSSRYQRAA